MSVLPQVRPGARVETTALQGLVVDSIPLNHDSCLRQLAAQDPLELRVKGDCMTPLIADGDRVRVAPRRCYVPGDILVFRGRSGQLVSHRLLGWYLERGRLRLLTQADRAPLHDAPLSPRQVLGRLVGGACRPEAVRIPIRHRLRAFARFLAHAWRRLSRLKVSRDA